MGVFVVVFTMLPCNIDEQGRAVTYRRRSSRFVHTEYERKSD